MGGVGSRSLISATTGKPVAHPTKLPLEDLFYFLDMLNNPVLKNLWTKVNVKHK